LHFVKLTATLKPLEYRVPKASKAFTMIQDLLQDLALATTDPAKYKQLTLALPSSEGMNKMIRAILMAPTTGKSTLTQAEPERFVDIDDVITDHYGPAYFDTDQRMHLTDPEFITLLKERAKDKILLTHTWYDDVPGLRREDVLAHVAINNDEIVRRFEARGDTNVSPSEILTWSFDGATIIPSDAVVSGILELGNEKVEILTSKYHKDINNNK